MSAFYDAEIVEGKFLQPTVPNLAPSLIFIPTVDDNPICLSDQLLGQHLLLVGGIGQGKTNAICHILHSVRETMGADDITIVFDTKGDYLRRFRRPGDIVINDLDREVDDNPWNLLAEIRSASDADREETLSEIGHTLFDDMLERTQNPFFPAAARDVFGAVLRGLASHNDTDNYSLRRFWDEQSFEEIKTFIEALPSTKGILHYISQAGPQTQGVLSHVVQLIHDLFIGRFAKKGTLSIRSAVRGKGGKCIFIEYDVATGKAQSTLYRLIVDLAIKEALSRRRTAGRVFFFIDEFRLLPRLMHLDHGLNFGRECGVRFVVGMQNHDQVRASYEDEAASILSAFGTVIAFRVSDPNTRDFIKGLGGRNLKRVAVPNLVPGPLVQQIVEGAVVEDYQVWDLRRGEAITFMPETIGPFRARIALFADGSRK